MTVRQIFAMGVCGAAALFGLCAAAAGVNLINNPGFTGGVSPWIASPSATLTYDPADEAGVTSSGSGRVMESGTSIGSISQCLVIDPSVHYRFRADILFPTGQIPSNALVYYYSYPTTNCVGPTLTNSGVYINNYVPERDGWQTIRNDNVYVKNVNAHSIILYLAIDKTGLGAPGTITANWDNVVLEPGTATGPCSPDNQDLCLSDYRFRVHADFDTGTGSQFAHSVQLTSDSGVFTFFDPGNVELQLKVLDACSFANRYWVFGSGTTNVGVTLTVTDTKTGTVKTYSNPLNHIFAPVLDTSAFATCP